MMVDRHYRRRGGYILLTVIAVSVLVTTSLATLATLSLRRGLEASDAERALQQRWGAMTIEHAMLRQAPMMFNEQEERLFEQSPGTPNPTTIRVMLRLRDVNFDVLVGDEDAKLNLNTVFHHGGPEATGRALSRIGGPIVGISTRMIPAVEPMPASQRTSGSLQDDPRGEEDPEDDSDDSSPIPDAFRSWGEVFDLSVLDVGLARGADLPNLTTGITCWGSGQLNFRRASDEAILAVTGLVVQDGAARRLVQRYRQNPTTTLAILLQSEVSREEDRIDLARLISQSSSNFSVWIDASSQGGEIFRSFAVMRRDDEGVTRLMKFRH